MENDQEKPTVSSPTSTALLCCPFCGGEVEARLYVRDGSQGAHKVECYNCDIHIIKPSKELTIKAWNKRAS